MFDGPRDDEEVKATMVSVLDNPYEGEDLND